MSRQAGSYLNTMDSAAKAIGQTGSRQQSRRVSQVRGDLATKIRLRSRGRRRQDCIPTRGVVTERFILGIDGGDFDDDSVPDSVTQEMQDRIVSSHVGERYAENIGSGG